MYSLGRWSLVFWPFGLSVSGCVRRLVSLWWHRTCGVGVAVDTVSVRVVGLTWSCWKCSERTLCVLGLCRKGDREIITGDEALGLARAILVEDGREDVAGLLVQHHSHSGEPLGLASDCSSCGVLQGNFYVRKEALARTSDGDGLAALEVIAEGECAQLEWDRVADDFLGGSISF